MLEGDRYKYAIAFNERRITYERLTVYSGRKPQRWFERSFDANTQIENWTPFSVNVEGHREMWRKATRPRALFVTTAAQLDGAQFVPLLRWFQTHLEFVLSPIGLLRCLCADPADAGCKLQEQPFECAAHDKNSHRRYPNDRPRRIRATANNALRLPVLDRADRGGGGGDAIEVSYAKPGAPPIWINLAKEGAPACGDLFFLLGPLLDTIQNSKLADRGQFRRRAASAW